MDPKELRLQRKKLVEQCRALLDKAESEKRELTAEEQGEYAKLDAEVDALEGRYTRLEKQAEREQALKEPVGRGVIGKEGTGTPSVKGPKVDLGVRGTPEYHEAFMSYVRHGERTPYETRATLQVDLAEGGGFYAASEQFINGLLQAPDDLLAIRQLATKYRCAYGENLGQISLDGDISEFEFGGGETQAASEDTGIAFGKRELKPKPMKRKLVKISKALLQSARINAETVVRERAGYQLAAGQETGFMTGDGATQPLGLFTVSNDGIPASRDSSTGMGETDLTGDGLISAQGMLDSVYDGAAVWLLHRDGRTRIRKLKTGDGQYLWQPGLRDGEPDMLLGKRIVTGSKVPNVWSSGLYVGMYGDFSKYAIADAVSLNVQVLSELYALTGQIGLLFDMIACDAMPMLSSAFVRLKLA